MTSWIQLYYEFQHCVNVLFLLHLLETGLCWGDNKLRLWAGSLQSQVMYSMSLQAGYTLIFHKSLLVILGGTCRGVCQHITDHIVKWKAIRAVIFIHEALKDWEAFLCRSSRRYKAPH